MRRSQWLTNRPILSNWLSPTESEAKRKVSLSRSTETFSSSPLLMGLAAEVIGLFTFGSTLVPQSEAPRSEFLDVNEVRDHWLSERESLSNWRTIRQNEEYEPVSLSYQQVSISASPLLFDGLTPIIGFSVFGIPLLAASSISLDEMTEEEDLFDTLATEDFDPIVTEDEMDEISLG